MLTDPPRPEDLPERGGEPYAALPPDLVHALRASGEQHDAPPASTQPQAPTAHPAPGRSTGTGGGRRAAVAMVLVLALIAALAFTVMNWPRPAPQSSPTTPTSSGPATSQPPTTKPTTPSPSTPVPASTDHPKALASFYTQQVAWEPCSDSGSHQCATIEVPVDYTRPTGDTFELALRKVPALEPAQRIGSLFINPGGPGGSGIQYAQFASLVFSKELRSAYDIVGFDPRGIGDSDAVACLTDAEIDALFAADPTPDTAAERTRLLAAWGAATDGCAKRGGDRVLHMSSTEVARDLDVMRALVGDPKLNYFGVSYGTFLGALYADLFPQRVGRFVLDSAVSPNQTDLQKLGYDVQGFESSIAAFVDWCVAQDDCALGTDPAKAEQQIVDLLDRIDRTPLTTSKPGLPTVGEGWIGFAIFMCLYSEETWPTLNKGLTQAIEEGRGDALVSLAFSVVSRSSKGGYADSSYLHAMIPVRCADWPRTPDTPSFRTQREKLQDAHPLWARLTGELFDNCSEWPGEARKPSGTKLGVGAAPILVIGNLRDPATPIGGTEQLAADLDSATLVTSDSDGHGAYYSGDSCVDGVVDDYLIQGTVPPARKAC